MARPSLIHKWKTLYELAIQFKEKEYWEWMYDSDLFGVQNPRTGEIGYCCVMGNLGEHYALAVYPGAEGLATYIELANQDPDNPDPMILLSQKCLQVSFENREQLHKEDHEVIKKLGLKFRGANNWPLFRNYSPGYLPWFINEEEIDFLTALIPQAMDVCDRAAESLDVLKPPREAQMLVRVAEAKGKEWIWRDEWQTPALPAPEHIEAPIDQLRLHKILKTAQKIDAIWEFDYFHFPEGVRDGSKERPYFPLMLIWADQRSSMILSHEISPPGEYRDLILNQFLKLIERSGAIPRQVWLQQDDARAILEPSAKTLGVELELTSDLEAIDDIFNHMLGFFGSRKSSGGFLH